MPYRDREEKIAHDAAYYQTHKEQIRIYDEKYRAEHIENMQAYRSEHKERRSLIHKAWVASHPEQAKAIDARFRAAHPEKRAADRAKWYAQNADAVITRNMQWTAEHPESKRAAEERRRARKAKSPMNDLTTVQWQERLHEYNNHCAYCLAPLGDEPTMDHMTPLSRGGDHTLSNVVPACGTCNSKKGTKTLLEYVIATGGVFSNAR
jgi:5-methylcytosine-specific restriction endonuclease McrA